jgi:gallate decarboxylase subunit D
MNQFAIDVSKGRLRVYARVQKVGEDILVSLWGGTRPHIGAVGIAVPRPSLENPKRWSATSSTLTFLGHKEDMLVKKISEKLASRLKRNVVMTAGIHWDTITPQEIKTVGTLVDKLSDQITKKLSGTGKKNRRNGNKKKVLSIT